MGINEWERQSLDYKLFGAEIFNSRLYFNIRRTFHTDYMTLLVGSGVIGVLILFIYYYSMLRHYGRRKIDSKQS